MLATNYTTLINLRQELIYNEASTDVNGNTQYIPLTIKTYGQAITSDGGKKDVSNAVTVGNPTSTPLTSRQIYTALGSVGNLNTRVQGAIKQLYIDSISDDISA